MNTYYVVTWDFELEQSGDIVKDGVVFSDLESAQKEYGEVLIASIDAGLRTRSESTFSRRIGKSGYITGETCLREVESPGIENALQEALAGKGQDIT